MNILSLDTSTKTFSLAVIKNDKIAAAQDILLKQVLSDSIIPSIDHILKKSRLSLPELDGFAVGLGPGSFTSLRVGLATVKGLAWALNKNVVGISSLDVIAAGTSVKEGRPVCVVCDARRNLVYAGRYIHKKEKLKREGAYLLSTLADFLKEAPEDSLFVGDGLTLFGKEIKRRCKKAAFAPEKYWYPQAKNLACLALGRFSSKGYDSVDKIKPIYLYPEDCQVQK